MLKKSTSLILILTSSLFLVGVNPAYSSVIRESGKTYIIDRTGEKWEVTQAESIGFKPEGFEFGLGRDAIQPLDDSQLSEKAEEVVENLRVIGVEDGTFTQAYSVSRLTQHEIANSHIGSKPIAAAY